MVQYVPVLAILTLISAHSIAFVCNKLFGDFLLLKNVAERRKLCSSRIGVQSVAMVRPKTETHRTYTSSSISLKAETLVIGSDTSSTAANMSLNIRRLFQTIPYDIRLHSVCAIIGVITSMIILIIKHGIMALDRSINTRIAVLSPILGSVLVSLMYIADKNIGKAPLQYVAKSNEAKYAYKISLKQLLWRILALITSIGTGCSLGLAGPAAELGMAISFFIGTNLLPSLSSDLLLSLVVAGAGAGLAANFNAPLTGALFAIEVTSRSLPQQVDINAEQEQQKRLMLLCAVFPAVMLVRRGDLFQISKILNLSKPLVPSASFDFFAFTLLGIISGLVFERFSRMKDKLVEQLKQIDYRARPLIGGLGNSFAAHFNLPQSLSSGFTWVNLLSHSHLSLAEQVKFTVAKFLTTSLSTATGLIGGLFAPTIFMGAGLGAVYHTLIMYLHQRHLMLQISPAASYVLAGGAAMLACNFKSALMASIFVVETTQATELSAALLLTSFISTRTSGLISKLKSDKR